MYTKTKTIKEMLEVKYLEHNCSSIVNQLQDENILADSTIIKYAKMINIIQRLISYEEDSMISAKNVGSEITEEDKRRYNLERISQLELIRLITEK